jgi:hypothetical protein
MKYYLLAAECQNGGVSGPVEIASAWDYKCGSVKEGEPTINYYPAKGQSGASS